LLSQIALALLAVSSSSTQPQHISYEALVEEARTCKCAKKPVSESLLRTLVDVEKSFNPPESVRGMVLAAACKESCFNPEAKGDRKFSKSGKKPMAIGILQLWPVYKKILPGLDRTNPKQSAMAWMKHIAKQVPKVKKLCKYRTPYRVWVAAWVTGIRYKKKDGRCRERPKHLRLLRKWHRNIKNKTKAKQ
jgi:hypothetical protein